MIFGGGCSQVVLYNPIMDDRQSIGVAKEHFIWAWLP
jgi:hypothetical protein